MKRLLCLIPLLMLILGCPRREPLPDEKTMARMTPQQRGGAYFRHFACASCHRLDDKKGLGPAALGMWGRTVTHTDGSTATVDRAYLAQKLRDPRQRTTVGFSAGSMPVAELTDVQIDELAAYLKSVKSSAGTP